MRWAYLNKRHRGETYGRKPVYAGCVEVDGYKVYKSGPKAIDVYEEHPSGQRVKIGRCATMGGVKRLIAKHKRDRG
jgi:hypothetical protein